jgi:hypothetical protein
MLYITDFLFCFFYEGHVRTTETRCLLIVLFHKRNQTPRSMQNLTFLMFQLMKQMVIDLTRKVFSLCLFFSAIHFFIITMQKFELVFCLIISDFIIHFCIMSLSSLQSTIMDTCKAESISASKPQDTIH